MKNTHSKNNDQCLPSLLSSSVFEVKLDNPIKTLSFKLLEFCRFPATPAIEIERSLLLETRLAI